MKTQVMLAVLVFSLGLVGDSYAKEDSFAGDIDGDLDVDAVDLSILTSYWLAGGCDQLDACGHADLDHNHEVDLADFALLGWNWLQWIRTLQSHTTHRETEGDGVRGPDISCADCHDTHHFPFFKSGSDNNSDGKYNLEETDVCNGCHSPDGAFNGVNSTGASVGAKAHWDTGVYDGNVLQTGKETWCVGCHDSGSSVIDLVSAANVGGDAAQTGGFYVNGHKQVACLACHDASLPHIDGRARTYAFDSSYCAPSQSGVVYARGYRLRYVNGEVPLMIPANYNITFSYNAALIRDTAFRLCRECHDFATVFDDTPGDGIDSNFKASAPNPPRNYSYAWGSGADVNEHVAHLMNYVGPFADSDWDSQTAGPGGQTGSDSLIACSSCHNVHGAAGTAGSTNEAMIRDGSLAGRTGYGFSYLLEDTAGYPMVTSTSATRSSSVGAIFRHNTANMCSGSLCHDGPAPPAGSSYNAQGSSWGTYLEYYRPYQDR